MLAMVVDLRFEGRYLGFRICKTGTYREVDTPEMVKVMELWGRQEGEVVSTVGDGGADQGHAVPHGGGGDVRAQDHWPDHHRH